MARRRSSIKGDFKLRRLLRDVGQLEESALPAALQKAANLVLETQLQLIPRDTGAAANALKAHITKANQSSGLDARVGIVGKRNNEKFFYLRFVEYGTKGYKPKLKAQGSVLSDGENFFGKTPNIPARPAHPWLRPSIDMNRDQIREIIRRAIDQTLAQAAQGARNG